VNRIQTGIRVFQFSWNVRNQEDPRLFSVYNPELVSTSSQKGTDKIKGYCTVVQCVLYIIMRITVHLSRQACTTVSDRMRLCCLRNTDQARTKSPVK